MTTEGASLAPLEAFEVPELRRRARSLRLRTALFLIPAGILAALFLYAPLALMVNVSLTTGSSFLSATGPIYAADNYALMLERYVPNLLITVQLAFLAMVVDLVFGFPFAYILVRRVRYRDVVRALMVFPMFGALYVAFGMRFLLLPNGAIGAGPGRARDPRHGVPVQPAGRRLRDVDLHVPVHGHEHRHGPVQRRSDARGGGRLPRRAVVADLLAGHPAAHPGRASWPACCWSSAGASGRSPSRSCWAGSTSSARSPGRSTSAA